MIRHFLAGLCRRLASWLEPSPIEEAIRRADDARAIRMEFERQMHVRRAAGRVKGNPIQSDRSMQA